jgi:hypothetical protein
MFSKKRNPAALGADGVRKVFCLAANSSDNSAHQLEIQHRRATWIARRHAISLAMAFTVAALAFGEGSQ